MSSFLRISLVYLTFITITLVSSCSCPEVLDYYDIQGMILIQHKTLADHSKINLLLHDQVDRKTEQYQLEIQYKFEYYADQFRPSFMAIPSAYARSCFPNGDKGTIEMLTGLYLITKHDIDKDHQAGDTINDLFKLGLTDSALTVEEYLLEPRKIKSYRKSYFLDQMKLNTEEAFLLELDIILEIDSSEIYSATTHPVTFE